MRIYDLRDTIPIIAIVEELEDVLIQRVKIGEVSMDKSVGGPIES